MRKILTAFLAILLCFCVSFAGSISNANSQWDRVDVNLPLGFYANATDITNGLYGTIWAFGFINPGSVPLNFLLLDENQNIILNESVSAGDSYYNRSVNYTTFGRAIVQVLNEYTSSALFPFSLASFRFDEMNGTTSVDQQGNNSMELSSSSLWVGYPNVQIIGGAKLTGSQYLQLNHSTGINLTTKNFSIVFGGTINGKNNNTYLFHQGALNNENTTGKIAAKLRWDNDTAANSSYIEYTLYNLSSAVVKANTTGLTNASGVHYLHGVSNPIKNSAYPIRLNVTYQYANGSNISVALNGNHIGYLNTTSPNSFIINPLLLHTGTNNITFVSNNTLSNITNSSIQYSTFAEVKINTTLGVNEDFPNKQEWYGLSVLVNTTHTNITTFRNGTEKSQTNLTYPLTLINADEPYYFGDGINQNYNMSGTYDEIYFVNGIINTTQMEYLSNRTAPARPSFWIISRR